MKDERKKWIKAKLYDSSDEKEYSVKIKLHGGGLSFISNGSLGLRSNINQMSIIIRK